MLPEPRKPLCHNILLTFYTPPLLIERLSTQAQSESCKLLFVEQCAISPAVKACRSSGLTFCPQLDADPLCRQRLEEMRTAVKLMVSLAAGSPLQGLQLSDAPQDFMASLKGRLDMECLASLGHSFGGGPSCALPVESSPFKCGIGMDPYWWAFLPALSV